MTLIYTTFPSEKLAHTVASQLIEKKLIACANIFEMKALFTWKDKTENSPEWAALFKTKKELFKDVEAKILELHEYECPCIISLKTQDVSEGFEKWIKKSTKN